MHRQTMRSLLFAAGIVNQVAARIDDSARCERPQSRSSVVLDLADSTVSLLQSSAQSLQPDLARRPNGATEEQKARAWLARTLEVDSVTLPQTVDFAMHGASQEMVMTLFKDGQDIMLQLTEATKQVVEANEHTAEHCDQLLVQLFEALDTQMHVRKDAGRQALLAADVGTNSTSPEVSMSQRRTGRHQQNSEVAPTMTMTYAPFGSEVAATVSCATPVARNCAFYAGCIEANKPCGENGYALGYGGKYCKKFSETLGNPRSAILGADIEAWMWAVLACLQQSFIPVLPEISSWTCDEITDFAYNSHPQCYAYNTQVSICELGIINQLRIVTVIDPKDLFGMRGGIQQILTTAGMCINQWTGFTRFPYR